MMSHATPLSIRRGSAQIAGVVLALVALAACSPSSDETPASASSTPTPAPTTSPPAPTTEPPEPHEIVSGADVAILERLEAPTTGEVWQTPVEIASLGLFPYQDAGTVDAFRYFHIGNRDGSRIIAAVEPYFEPLLRGHNIFAVIEHDGVIARMVTCPSSRTSDGCLTFSEDWLEEGRSIDTAIHYDSLTYPVAVEPVPGWTLRLGPLAHSPWPVTIEAFGEANAFPGFSLTPDALELTGLDGDRSVLAELGESALVEWRSPSPVPGIVESYLAVETPYGGSIPSRTAFTDDWYGVGAVTWDDARDTFTHPAIWDGGTETFPVRPANLACVMADDALATSFDESQWVKAGTHRKGLDVYVPVPGGNAISQAVFTTMKDSSWAHEVEPTLTYPYTSYADFEAARSVFAWERPDGEWAIAVDAYALQRVWECV